MIRNDLSLCLIGFVFGSIAAYLAYPNRQPPSSTEVGFDAPAAIPVGSVGGVTTSIDRDVAGPANASIVATGLAGYLEAAGMANAEDLSAAIERAAELPEPGERNRALEPLLLRLVEIEPQHAVRLADRHGVEMYLIVHLYRVWAASNPDAVLAELRDNRNQRLARAVALQLGDVIDGIGEAVVDHLHRGTFETQRLRRLAERDPRGALTQAIALGDSRTRTRTVQEVAGAWARQDPLAAFEAMRQVGDLALQVVGSAQIAEEWARFDPDAALAFLASPAGYQALEIRAFMAPMMRIAADDPEGVLRAAERMPSAVRNTLRTTALWVMATRDAVAATAYVESLPAGGDRASAINALARAYGWVDPVDALAWAQTLERSSSITAYRAIALQIGLSDLAGAVDLALATPDPEVVLRDLLRYPLPPPVLAPLSHNIEQLGVVADRLLGVGLDASLESLVAYWSTVEPEAALAWSLANNSALDTGVVKRVAEGFARGDVNAAVQMAASLPADLRGELIAGVAQELARSDVDEASRWLTAFRGEPDYDAWMSSAAQRLAHGPTGDSRAAAQLLNDVRKPSLEAVATVASGWAYSDPDEAYRWAMGQADPEVRSIGVSAAAAAWASLDPGAASAQVLGLPGGQMRDQALSALLEQGIAARGAVDPQLLDAFSSANARATAFDGTARAFAALGARDLARAEALIAEHIDDPVMREHLLGETRTVGRD